VLDVGLGVVPHQVCCGEDVHPLSALVGAESVAVSQSVGGQALGFLLERLPDVVALSIFKAGELLCELIADCFVDARRRPTRLRTLGSVAAIRRTCCWVNAARHKGANQNSCGDRWLDHPYAQQRPQLSRAAKKVWW